MVHGGFARRLGHLFGCVIAGSFQDELPYMPTWSPDLGEEFLTETRYDPLPHLAALWEDLGERGGAVPRRLPPRAGRAGGAVVLPAAARVARAPRAPVRGGPADRRARGRAGRVERDLRRLRRTHRWFSAPGSDHHGDAKLHSSIAHHYDRPRVWIESFHTSGWGGTLEETFDWLLPWIGAGANLYNPHATYYSTRAGWWEWAPPATDGASRTGGTTRRSRAPSPACARR